MPDEACPRCSATLHIETRGELHDKMLVCRHCGFERDVLDEVRIHKKEPGKEVTIHRRDLGGEVDLSSVGEPADIEAQVREMVGDDVGDVVRAALSGGIASGKVVTHTSTSVHRGRDAEEQLAEMGIDIDALVANAKGTSSSSTTEPSPKKGLPRWAWALIVLAVLAPVAVVVGAAVLVFVM